MSFQLDEIPILYSHNNSRISIQSRRSSNILFINVIGTRRKLKFPRFILIPPTINQVSYHLLYPLDLHISKIIDNAVMVLLYGAGNISMVQRRKSKINRMVANLCLYLLLTLTSFVCFFRS